MAMCATEGKGAFSPRTVQTTIRRSTSPSGKTLLVNGVKSFVTLGSFASSLLVLAHDVDEAAPGPATATASESKPLKKLRVVRIDSKLPGVHLEDLPSLSFIPEISHARVSFTNVELSESDLLPNDGYIGYLKPFRTIEDMHVNASVLGHAIQLALDNSWDSRYAERAAAAYMAMHAILPLGSLNPAAHVALQGVLHDVAALVTEIASKDWNDAEAKQRWQRDLRVIQVASGARAQRTSAAWKILLDEQTAKAKL